MPSFPNIHQASSNKLITAAHVRPSPIQLAWQRMELAAFFHFTVNTFTNKEWGNGKEDPAIFNPTELDARQWIKTVADAGFKLAILTAKHHDGFCLWPSEYTEHSVKNSPYKDGKGDVVKEFAEACHEFGVGVGIYLSPWDRHEPTYGTPAYNDYFIHQLTELLTNYGPIAEVWFDGACAEGPNGRTQVYDWDAYYATVRRLQPGAVISGTAPDVRWVGNESGLARENEWSVVPAYLRTPEIVTWEEGKVPPTIKQETHDLGSRAQVLASDEMIWYPAECDVSIRPGWFFHKHENLLVKSPKKLVDLYYKSVGR
ncbi:MAG: alpha-L-fucosidase, partial [Anaerolineae bacterium]|nr:alpha-L-fucosidase [Anaerolineae bacterium]